MTVAKYLQASTGNLAEDTAKAIDAAIKRFDGDLWSDDTRLPIAYGKGEYGWWVHVPEANDGIAPPELCDLLDEARRLGCNWIEFDRDNDPLDNFPLFDW